MDWKNGYSARYYITIVDPNSWKDRKRYEITDGTINKTASELRESADISCPDYDLTNEQIIRVWLDAFQNGGASHTPLFTGYATTPSREINGVRETKSLQCYSVLKPAQDILLARGWYAPAEIDGSILLKQLLKPTKSPVGFSEKTIEKRTLKKSIVAEDGETNLSMIEKILYALDWRLVINGLGEIEIGPYSADYLAVFDMAYNDILEPSIKVEYDWYECPNVFRAILDDDVEIARDESDNIMSIPSRGREVWAEDTNATLSEQETLLEYARRRLKELQSVYTTVTYDRRFQQDIYPTDVVYLNYPSHDLVGKYVIVSQSIALDFNAKTAEEVRKI